MIKAIVDLMVEIAKERQNEGHIKDFVTALYAVKMDVNMEIGKKMNEIRNAESHMRELAEVKR